MSVSRTPDKNVGYALAWLILGMSISGVIAMISVPFSIGLYGLRGLWIPALLCVPSIFQCAAAYHLKRLIGPSRLGDPFQLDDAPKN